MRKIIIILSVLFFLISCKSENKNYIKNRNNFIESYMSLDFDNFFSERNKIELPKSKKLLEKLIKSSTSDQKYFFNLMSFRLFLIESKRKEATNQLNSIKDINPMMFYFYKGIIYELLEGNIDLSKDQYRESVKYCSEDFFKLYLNYLIDENLNSFLESLGKYDYDAQRFYKNIYSSYGADKFRVKIIINEVFNNFYLPEK